MGQHSSIPPLCYYSSWACVHRRSRIASVVLWIHLWQSYCIEAELTNSAYEPSFPLRLFCNHSITTQQSMIPYCCCFFLTMSDP